MSKFAFSFLAVSLVCSLFSRASAGTIGYWRFEEGSGSTANDYSGFGNNAIINQANLHSSDVAVSPIPNSGAVNNHSLHLNGTGQFALVPDSASLRPSSAITIEAFVKLDSSVVGNAAIVGRQLDTTAADSFNLGLRGHAGVSGFDYPFVSLQLGGVSANVDLDVPLNLGQWYYLAATYNGSQLSMFVDSKLEGTTAASGSISYPFSNPVVLGADNEASGNLEWFFPGRIDEVRISDKALATSQFLSAPPPPESEVTSGTIGSFLYWESTDIGGDLCRYDVFLDDPEDQQLSYFLQALTFTGAINQDKGGFGKNLNKVIVDNEDDAVNVWNDPPNYEAALDSWFSSPFTENLVGTGVTDSKSGNEGILQRSYAITAGSGGGSQLDKVHVGQIVAAGNHVDVAGILGRNGISYSINGTMWCPEPSSFALLVMGTAMFFPLAFRRYRKRAYGRGSLRQGIESWTRL